MPAMRAVFKGRPLRKTPKETLKVWPRMTRSVRIRTAFQWDRREYGSTNMPTATKKTAANMSRKGWISRPRSLSEKDLKLAEGLNV